MSVVAAPGAEYHISDPVQDRRAFRSALGQYGTGVAVITTLNGGLPVGMTVNSFAAVSLDPPLILWSVQNTSGRAPAFVGAQHFAVNVLSADQVDVSRIVASPQGGTGAFEQIAWTEGLAGVPLIEGAIARFECRTYDVLPGGDHQILVGHVERCAVAEGEPLLFVQGGYAASAPFPSSGPGSEATTEETSPESEPAPFAQLVTAVNHRLSREFDEHRSRFGLSAGSGRVLKRLSTGPQTVDELVSSAFLGPQAIEDALSELIEENLVEVTGSGFRQTPQGRALRRQVAENARRFNEAALSGIPEADVEAAHRVLTALARSDQPIRFHHTKENA